MLLTTVFVALFTIWLYKRHRRMTLLRRHNIPGPPPNFLLGNSIEIVNKGILNCFKTWASTYGETFGFYLGGVPHVLTIDVELLRNVQIKDFELFWMRNLIIKGGIQPNKIGDSSIVFVTDFDRWKKYRHAVTPAFSAAKLQTMVDAIKHAAEEGCVKIAQLIDQDEVNMTHVFRERQLNTFARACFGAEVKVDQKLFDAAAAAGMPKLDGFWPAMMIIFPEFTTVLYPFRWLVEKFRWHFQWAPQGYVLPLVKQVIELRRRNRVPGDFLDMLLTTRISTKASKNVVTAMDDGRSGRPEVEEKAVENNNEPTRRFNDEEVIGNCFVFFGAAYATSASAFNFIMHHLINYPEYQDEIREEVKQLIASDGSLNYNVLYQLPLLDGFIKETMRFYPPVDLFVSRVAAEDYKYKDIVIPKGIVVSGDIVM